MTDLADVKSPYVQAKQISTRIFPRNKNPLSGELINTGTKKKFWYTRALLRGKCENEYI